MQIWHWFILVVWFISFTGTTLCLSSDAHRFVMMFEHAERLPYGQNVAEHKVCLRFETWHCQYKPMHHLHWLTLAMLSFPSQTDTMLVNFLAIGLILGTCISCNDIAVNMLCCCLPGWAVHVRGAGRRADCYLLRRRSVRKIWSCRSCAFPQNEPDWCHISSDMAHQRTLFVISCIIVLAIMHKI